MEPAPADVTSLLNKLADSDQEAAAELVPLVYEELRRLAARRLRHERPDHTLQATALVHEAYVKLAAPRDAKWQNRAQFFGVASQVMRRILVDYARGQKENQAGRQAAKGSLDDVLLVSPERTEEVLTVHESLSRLEKLDARQARIVELRYFAGLTVEEIAEVVRRSNPANLRARRIVPRLAKRNTEHGSGLGRWRWVVERTFAWLNQFRRLRIRHEKRADIHEAFLALACILICWRFLDG